MNKIMGCDCTASITDPVRKARFAGIFPNDDIPIKHPMVAGTAKTGNEIYQFYDVAVDRLSEEQKREIVKRVAPVFGLKEQEILADMANPEFKIPLKVDSIITSWCKLHSRMVL